MNPDSNSNKTAAGGQPTPIIRDVLGGDEGKAVPVVQALGDSLEKQTAHSSQLTAKNPSDIHPLATPTADTETLEADLTPKQTPPAASTQIPEGFVPVAEKQPAESAQLTSSMPQASEPVIVIPEPIATIQPTTNDQRPTPTLAQQTANSQQPTATQEITPQYEARPTNEIPQTLDLKPTLPRSAIRTLQSDIASSVKDNNMSLARMAIARQEKTTSAGYTAPEKKKFTINVWALGAIIFLIAGAAIVVGAFAFVARTNIPLPFIPAAPLAPTLITVEGRETLDATQTTRVDFIKNITAFVDADYLSPVRIEALIIEEAAVATSTELTAITLERFLEILNTRAPGRFIRSVGPSATFGRVGSTPFLLTTVDSYETAFAGLLEWETFMAEDLGVVAKKLTANSQQPTAEEGAPVATSTESATTTSVATSSALTSSPQPLAPLPAWKDIVIRNKDVRALIDETGEIHLLYAFPKDGYLVFTNTREALAIIVDTLNSPVFGR